ncbi:MAG: hsp70 family protein [Caulobacterales bacterium 68-7]|nr:MAG: hsp70 family protein [Caulobacterales bacterium 68-7]
MQTIGIDFGTTNTVVARGDGAGGARLVDFPVGDGRISAFRSALSFYENASAASGRTIEAGPFAIDAYLEDPAGTRFIQSFKSYAASALFTETRVLNRRFTFEDLLAAFLLKLRDHAEGALDDLPPRVVVGRPVTFVGSSPDERLALTRYQDAFARLGFKKVLYAYEPVAAAFFFARQLQADATVLVADFGGGTSDFSIVRFEREGGVLKSTALGNAGVGLAGDAFDYRIIDNLVSPALGKGSEYRSFAKILPIPNRYYSAFARWEQLALLRTAKTMREIESLVRDAVEPEKIARLVELLDENYGYRLYQSVSRLKEALSAREAATFSFREGGIVIEREVERATFEGWIAPELTAMAGAVDQALAAARLAPGDIDKVFLTGGTSFVPAVRRLFVERFGEGKVESGGELVSIATGLAMMAAEPDIEAWTQRAP